MPKKLSDKTIERKLKDLIKSKQGFQQKYWKNIVIHFCHVESTTANTSNCYICNKGVPTKDRKKSRYGFHFGQFSNKRHGKRGWHPRFTPDLCDKCVSKIEEILNYKFVRSYAP